MQSPWAGRLVCWKGRRALARATLRVKYRSIFIYIDKLRAIYSFEFYDLLRTMHESDSFQRFKEQIMSTLKLGNSTPHFTPNP